MIYLINDGSAVQRYNLNQFSNWVDSVGEIGDTFGMELNNSILDCIITNIEPLMFSVRVSNDSTINIEGMTI